MTSYADVIDEVVVQILAPKFCDLTRKIGANNNLKFNKKQFQKVFDYITIKRYAKYKAKSPESFSLIASKSHVITL